MRFFHTGPRGPMQFNESPEMPDRIRRTSPMRDDGGYRCSPPQNEQPLPQGEEALLLHIQHLDFVKVELELYLDAYPKCTSALNYYREVVAKLKAATNAYEEKFGPLTADASRGDSWTWVQGKWPWQMDLWR